MVLTKMSEQELMEQKVGSISLSTVMAVMAIAVMAVVIYKLFLSSKGSTNVPGGWKFSWAE